MAIYRGRQKVAGVGNGFLPSNTGSTGDKLEKTPTGYQWVDGELVEITEGSDDYSAMRGPCTEGFHVPTKEEWEGVITIMTSLGINNSNSYRDYLHMPYTGSWQYNAGTKRNEGSSAKYWTSEVRKDYFYGYGIQIVNDDRSVYMDDYMAEEGYPIRPFKDGFVAPGSSWTVIQGTLGSAGIFRDTVNGLISITGDGTTGYTIADKNLGATTVYSNGDTLSQNNCGKLYQWGNNYGFSFSGSLTTSSTAVNASSYGPGNYYSSSTFIITNPRDSSKNANLWGGETGIVKIYDEFTAGGKYLAGKEYVDDMLGDVETLLANI